MKQSKVPTITPHLDQRYACLKYDAIPKTVNMKKRKTPSWFYGSHAPKNLHDYEVLPGISDPHQKSNPIKNELEKLERIQEWLRRSHRSPVGILASPPLSASNKSSSEGFIVEPNKIISSKKSAICQSGTSKLYKPLDGDDEDTSQIDTQINSEPILPKLNVFKTLTGDNEIIGTSMNLTSYYKPGIHKSVSVTNEQVSEPENTGRYILSEYQPKSLPGEITAEEYIKRRSKTYFGLNNSFSGNHSSQQGLRNNVGPIQRPHVVSPMGNIIVRQRTRYGDTMMHAKSPSKAFTDQRGRTYMLHAKLKDMLLEP